MTRDEAIAKLRELQDPGTNPEFGHADADDVLCDLLIALGYQDVVDEWKKVNKWYA